MAIELEIDIVSDERLLALSRANPGYRFERSAEGKLIVAPAALFPSGGEGNLYVQVYLWTTRTHLGRAFPATGGITLADTGMKAPDTSYITKQRLAALSSAELDAPFPLIAPSVAFDLLSPSDTLDDGKKRVTNFVANGVALGVLIDPQGPAVLFLRPEREWVIHTTPIVEIRPEMPGFILDVGQILHEQRKGV